MSKGHKAVAGGFVNYKKLCLVVEIAKKKMSLNFKKGRYIDPKRRVEPAVARQGRGGGGRCLLRISSILSKLTKRDEVKIRARWHRRARNPL